MTAPDLVLTTLGAANSGRSTFLLGMYDILSTGLHGYFTFAEDPDQAVDLRDAWDLLVSEGDVPPPDEAHQSKYYRFVFSHGFNPLVTIDWMDYRGGALDDRTSSAADVAELRDRLNRSDSIYLVLDGGNLAKWLDDPGKLPFVQRKLQVRAMSDQVLQAMHYRQAQQLPFPSVVIIITKADLLRGPDRGVGEALAQVVGKLRDLLPAVWAQGITALVCPVKVGNFGEESTGTVDVSTIDPVGLHRPMIFSLMHYLTFGVGGRALEMDKAAANLSEVEKELAALNRGFAAVIHGRKAAALKGQAADYEDKIASDKQQAQADQDLITQLSQELRGHPIIRSGNLDVEYAAEDYARHKIVHHESPHAPEQADSPEPAPPPISSLQQVAPSLLPTDAAAPSPDAATSVAYDTLVRRAFAKTVHPGRLLFNPPERMRLGQTERVEVRLAPTLKLDAELLQHLRGHGEPRLEEIPIAPLMAVTLKGDGFQIVAYSDEEQIVIGEGITTWEFDIRALKRGQQRLVISVSLRIPLESRPFEHKSIPVREATIDVQVGVPVLIGHFAAANWQWFIGTAIAIAAVLVAVLH